MPTELTSRALPTNDLDFIKSPNIIEMLEEEDLTVIGNWVHDGYMADEDSRAVWLKRNEAGMDLAAQVQKAKTFPWPGCANVVFPLVSIAALQFKARSSENIFANEDIVDYRVIGENLPKELVDRAYRLRRHMSWQVMEEDRYWKSEMKKLLINLAIVGTNFKKTYFNGSLGRQVGELILAKDLIVNYWAKNLESASRVSHRIHLSRNEIYERVRRGLFVESVLDSEWYQGIASETQPDKTQVRHNSRTGVNPPPADEETPFSFIDQHRWLDLDHDGYAEPYIVTINENNREVVQITARWDKEEQMELDKKKRIICIKPTQYFTKYSFIPAMDGGFYDVGFGTLLGPLNESVNAAINQLLDAGTADNSRGGLIGRGAKIRGGVYTMQPWEWKRVDSSGDDLRKNVIPNEPGRPNTVMFQLLSLLIEYADRLASSTEALLGKLPGQNTPASTYQGTLEQGMTVYNDIFRGLYDSLKDEFKVRHIINGMFLPPERVPFGESNDVISAEDYKSNPNHVIPTADPNSVTTSMKLFQAQAIRMASKESPGYDLDAVEMNFLRAMKVQNPRVIFPGPGKVPPPKDPKLAVEEMRMACKKAELQLQQQQFLMTLMEERRLNSAKIIALEAQAYKLAKDAEAVGAQVQLESMKTVIEVLKGHGEALDQRIDIMMKLENEAQKNDPESADGEGGRAAESEGSPSESSGTGIPSMEEPPGDGEVLSDDEALEGGSEGAMGEEEL